MRYSNRTILLIAAAYVFMSPAISCAQNQDWQLASRTFYPNVNYFIGSGSTGADSLWINIGDGSHAAQFATLEVKQDSVLGTNLPCSITIEAYNGNARDTLKYQAPSSAGLVYSGSFAAKSSWAHGFIFTVPFSLSRKHGYLITVADTCKLTLIETIGR